MSPETLSSIDTLDDTDQIDPAQIMSLTDLERVAGANTTKVRALQRLLFQLRERGSDLTDVETAINRRSVRGAALIRRRQQLQNQENERRRAHLEELLSSSTGGMNNDRRSLMHSLEGLYERVVRLRADSTRHDQRRLSARLLSWEKTILACLDGLNHLKDLPTDVD